MNFNKKLAVAVSGAVLLMAGQFALADSTTDIVDALVSKGVLTEEEGKLISKGHTSKVDKTPVVKEKDGAFSLSSPNGKNSVQLTGRLHFDYRNSNLNNSMGTSDYYNTDRDTASVADSMEIRRARIGVKGRLAGMMDYELVGNLVGNSTNIVDVAYFDFNKFEAAGLKVGKFKQPYNLEELTSSNNIDFMERSYVNQNAPGKKMGAMLHGEFSNGFTYAGSVYQHNDAENDASSDNASYAGRLTANFAEYMGNKEMIMHVGLAGYDAEYSLAPALSNNTGDTVKLYETRGTMFSFRSAGRGMANIYRAQVAGDLVAGAYTTGLTAYGAASPRTAQVENRAGALEGIFAYGPIKIQGEYSSAFYRGTNQYYTQDYIESDVDTWYVSAVWNLTGEKYADGYKKGAMGLVKPKNEVNFDNLGSGIGLWEVGVRYEAFDVSGDSMTGDQYRIQGSTSGINKDGNTCNTGNASSPYVVAHASKTCGGGGANTWTAQLKWILNPNMVIKADYARTKFDTAFKPIDVSNSSTYTNYIDHEDLFMVRTQYMF